MININYILITGLFFLNFFQLHAQKSPLETPPPTLELVSTPPTPTPDQGTPIAPPEVVPTQLKWPEAVELSEEKPTLLEGNNPQIVELFKKGEDVLSKADVTMDLLLKKREDLYKKYYEIDAEADASLQGADVNQGALMEQIFVTSEKIESESKESTLVAPQFETELKQLNDYVQNIKDTKKSTKDLLTKVDQYIVNQKNLIIGMLNKKTQILKQKTLQDAQTMSAEIEKSFNDFKKVDEEINNDINKRFQTSVEQISSNITNIKNLIADLEKKGFAWQLAQAEKKAETKNVQQKPTTFSSWLIPGKKTGSDQEATFVHYLFKRMADLITGALNVVYETSITIKNHLMNFLHKTPEKQKESTQTGQEQKPVQTPAATPTPSNNAQKAPAPAPTPPQDTQQVPTTLEQSVPTTL